MFRRNDDFDEVKQYKKEQQRLEKERLAKERTKQSNRFSERDDFERDDRRSNKEIVEEQRIDEEQRKLAEELKKNYQPHEKNPFGGSRGRANQTSNDVMITLLSIGIAVIIFGFMFGMIANSGTGYNEWTDEKPMMEMNEMNAQEFLEEYRSAQDHYLDIDQLSGGDGIYDFDYDRAFSVDITHTSAEYYSDEFNENVRCVSVDSDDGYDLLTCAVEVYYIDNYYFPEDFGEALAQAGVAEKFNYAVTNTDKETIYFINGYVYSQEYIDLVKDWLENGGFE